jgi:RNA polymerase sigma factor (sigma-70 family)
MNSKQSKEEQAKRAIEYRNVEVDLAALARPDDRTRFDAEWDRFFAGYHARLMDYFGYQLPGWDERDELVQEIFIRAYRAIAVSGHALRSKEAAWSWLTKIGRNLLRDKRAKLKTAAAALELYAKEEAAAEKLRLSAASILDTLASDGEPDSSPWSVDAATFDARLSQLSDAERELLQLRVTDGLEWEAIAERVGRKAGAVRQQYSRMRKFLRDGS